MTTAKTMQDLIEKILKHIDMSEQNKAREDAERANACTMFAYGMANTLGLLGIEYAYGTWQDGAYERTGYFRADGVTLVKNSVIDWKTYAAAAIDEEHHWGSRELVVKERNQA